MVHRDGAIDMVATRPIAAGEDLLLCYGKLDNSMLLLDYGTPPAPCEHVAAGDRLSLILRLFATRVKE